MPQDVRQGQRRERLIEAALDRVGADGLAGLTVGSVATAAGLSKRYFYESFESLDELVGAALGQVFSRVGGAIESSGLDASAEARDVLDVAVRGALDVVEDPRAARLYLESAASPTAAAVRDAAVDALVEQLLGRVADSGRDLASVRLLGHLLVSGGTHVVALWLRGGLDLTRDELVDHLVDIGTTGAAWMDETARSR